MENTKVNSYRVTLPTGPCGVKEIADKLRDSMVQGVEEGTEHVYFPIDAEDQTDAVCSAQDLVKFAFGPQSGLYRDVTANRRAW
jgi:hypothetical protein